MERDMYGDLILDDYYSDYEQKICPGNLATHMNDCLDVRSPCDILADLIDVFPDEDYKYNDELAKVIRTCKECNQSRDKHRTRHRGLLTLTYERVDSL